MPKYKCIVCGRPAESVYCMQHKPKKPLKRTRIKQNMPKNMEAKLVEADKMQNFFYSLWKIRPHYSEVSGEFLGDEARTFFFHHILPKSRFPELRLNEDNIILLTFQEHQTVENDIYAFEEVNRRRDKIRETYGI